MARNTFGLKRSPTLPPLPLPLLIFLLMLLSVQNCPNILLHRGICILRPWGCDTVWFFNLEMFRHLELKHVSHVSVSHTRKTLKERSLWMNGHCPLDISTRSWIRPQFSTHAQSFAPFEEIFLNLENKLDIGTLDSLFSQVWVTTYCRQHAFETKIKCRESRGKLISTSHWKTPTKFPSIGFHWFPPSPWGISRQRLSLALAGKGNDVG